MTNPSRRRSAALLAVVASAVLVVVLTGCGRAAFVPYAPTAAAIPTLSEASSVHLGTHVVPLRLFACDASEFNHLWKPGPETSEWRSVIQRLSGPRVVGRPERVVWFRTRRFADDRSFDEQLAQLQRWFGAPCISSDDDLIVEFEPVTLGGLPDGSITVHWPRDTTTKQVGYSDDLMTTVISNRDQRLMMMVAWSEDPDAVPTEAFVDVANSAWSQFEQDNTR